MHSFKNIAKALVIVLICVILLKGLDLMLYPCTFMRNDVHAVSTREYDDLIVGTSHGKMNIDPSAMEEITGRSGHNICVGGEYGVDAYYLVKLALEKQNPTRIIYEVDPGYFVTEKEEGNNYLLFYHEFPLSMAKLEYFWASVAKCNFRTTLFPWYEYPLSSEIGKIKQNLYQKLNGNYDVSYLKGETQEYHENGFIRQKAVDTSKLRLPADPKVFEESRVNQDNMKYIRKLIALCKEKNIEFVAVTTPVPNGMLEKYSENFESAWEYFSSFFEEQKVPYLNFNTEYFRAFPHKIGYYTDFDGHMNGKAAEDYSRVLAKVITEKMA